MIAYRTTMPTKGSRVAFRSVLRDARRIATSWENEPRAPGERPNVAIVDKVTFPSNKAGILAALEGRFTTTERIY